MTCPLPPGSRQHRGADSPGPARVGQRPASLDPREGAAASGAPVHHPELETGIGDAAGPERDRKARTGSQQCHGDFKQMHR